MNFTIILRVIQYKERTGKEFIEISGRISKIKSRQRLTSQARMILMKW